MDQIIEYGNAIWSWFGVADNQNRAEAIAAVAAVVLTVSAAVGTGLWYVVRLCMPKGKNPDAVLRNSIPTGEVLSMDQHLTILEKREERMRDKLAIEHEGDKARLLDQIDELRRQIESPEDSLKEARTRNAALEALLERSGNDIGADRLAEAREALEQGDYSIADDIFAEIEARREMEVQEAARAAFGRGEIAEAEVRWADAAKHYTRASRLHPGFETLFKAVEFAQLSGDYEGAQRLSGDLLAVAQSNPDKGKLAKALDRQATVSWRKGCFEKADADFRQALTWAEKVTGVESSEYEQILNNLGINLKAQERYAEAEEILRRALGICGKTAGKESPEYGIRLSNLALILKEQGKYAEAEKLMLEAIAVHEKSLGKKHPTYSTDLANLAGIYDAEGRFFEAKGIYLQVLELDLLSIGNLHPTMG